jgi:hypothetical protein
MGKSAPKSQTITNKTELPAWVDQGGQENYQLATQLAGQLPGAYQGNVVAGLDSMMPAFQFAQGLVGRQEPWMQNAQFNNARAGAYNPQQVQGQNFLQGDVGAYMNPYIQNVEQAALTNMQDALAQNVNQIGDRAIGANAFGGSRQGVMEGAAAAQGAKDFGALSAALRSQGYDAASGMMRSDMDRALQGDMANQQAGLAGNQQRIQAAMTGGALAGQAQGMGYTDLASLMGIGEQFRGYEQALLAQDAARFDANKAAMLEPLNLRLSALGMSPYGSTQTQTREGFTTGSSPLTQGIGTAASLASIYGSLGGSAGIGSMFSWLPMLLGGSDERLKTDVQKMGKDKETGLDLYAYRYKGDPKSYPKVVGPMAQDIEKKFPDQVVNAGGRKAVNLGFGPMQRAFK